MTITVQGLAEAKQKMEQVAGDLAGDDFKKQMQLVTLMVLKTAREEAPVNTGRLKNSLTGEVTVSRDNIVQGVVGTNVTYGPYMELGTRPHFPPLAALQVWARRHGIPVFLVARAIARRGTAPRNYLQNAFDRNQTEIRRRLDSAVSTIVEKPVR
jgi:phage gpG-like protein